jgi:transposase
MKRRRFDADYKAKIALEAVQGNLTISELSTKYSIGPTQIKEWKAELLAKASAAFSKEAKPTQDTSELVAALERKVGQQAIQIDFLKKNLLKFPGKSD